MRHLSALLHDWGSPEQVDSAVLLVSEMITNVLVHTDTDALLLAEVTGGAGLRRLRVEVTDAGDDLPHKQQARRAGLLRPRPDTDRTPRGRLGVEPRGEGKSIWFELYEPGGVSADGPAGAAEEGAA